MPTNEPFEAVANGNQLTFHVRVGGDVPVAAPVIFTKLVEWMRARSRGFRAMVSETGSLSGFKCPELDPDPSESAFQAVLVDLARFLVEKLGGGPREIATAKTLVSLDDANLLANQAVLHVAMVEGLLGEAVTKAADMLRDLARKHARPESITVEPVNLIHGGPARGPILYFGHGPAAIITLREITHQRAETLGSEVAEAMGQNRFHMEVGDQVLVYKRKGAA